MAAARAPFLPGRVRVLSSGLAAAGDPVMAPDGRSVLFVGKEKPDSAWQIYQASLDGTAPQRLTSMSGGAMSPDFVSNGDLVFVSPVPAVGGDGSFPKAASVFAQSRQGPPHRLTFNAHDATDLTVLGDGRILFATAFGSTTAAVASAQALFTVNNDGTEFTLYAGRHDRALRIRRPREFGNRLGYVASSADAPSREAWAETVRSARPFSNEERLFAFAKTECASVSDGGGGTYLASLKHGSTLAIYRVATNATALGPALFDDPAWHDIEAVLATPRPQPVGHISAMSPAKPFGTILCLDANRTSFLAADGSVPKAETIRVTGLAADGSAKWLGNVPVHADGSFMAEVPADLPLGFEALDARGQVLRATPPVVWVRAGENRACLGCHEPHGRSPRNHRPLAVRAPLMRLVGPDAKLAQTGSSR
ncbi:MAG: hypothetical protein HZA90_05910 [Verrucomicrobia bacterium]|nr:hypothetical protein [Verrucomicrobiota bacterium]